MSSDQNRDQPGDRNKKTGHDKQHGDPQGGGGGKQGGGGGTKREVQEEPTQKGSKA